MQHEGDALSRSGERLRCVSQMARMASLSLLSPREVCKKVQCRLLSRTDRPGEQRPIERKSSWGEWHE